MNDPAITPDPFDGGCPADTTMTIKVQPYATTRQPPARIVYAVLCVYDTYEPGLVKCASLADAKDFASVSPESRFIIEIPVPRVA